MPNQRREDSLSAFLQQQEAGPSAVRSRPLEAVMMGISSLRAGRNMTSDQGNNDKCVLLWRASGFTYDKQKQTKGL